MPEFQDKIGGKLREVKGAATGDTGEELKGKAQRVKGKVEGAANDAKAQGRVAADDARATDKR